MSLLVAVALALAGGLGATARFAVDTLIRARMPGPFPFGTVIINASGSFLIGLVAGLLPDGGALGDVRSVIATGLLGGYTTFSTASFETVRLMQQRRGWAALANSVGVLCLAIALALLGLFAGGQLSLLLRIGS